MRAATGRRLDDVGAGVLCLLAYAGHDDPTPEQIAGAGMLANGLLDLASIRRALTTKG